MSQRRRAGRGEQDRFRVRLRLGRLADRQRRALRRPRGLLQGRRGGGLCDPAEGGWGLSIEKLWSVENGGSYGYYLNDSLCMSLADPVKNGDYLAAYSFSDPTGWSDRYSYFDKTSASGPTVTLTLTVLSFDADWNLVSSPAAGAVYRRQGDGEQNRRRRRRRFKLR